MAVTSFTIDTKLDETLQSLTAHYGVKSKAKVLRKAIALLKLISRYENDDGTFIIRKDNKDITVVLRRR